MDKIYTLLKERYHLKSSHISILNELNKGKELSARDIVYKTKIPIGSIYDFLRDLIDMKLIDINSSGANTYYVKDFEENMLNFVDNSFKDSLSSREELLKLVSQSKKSKQFVAYNDYNEFRLECFKVSPNPKKLFGNLRDFKFPIFFFPRNEKKYMKYKKALENKKNNETYYFTKSYWDSVESVKTIEWTVNVNELKEYFKIIEKNFGKDELNLRKKKIMSYVKKDNIKVRVLNKDIGYRYYLTENSFQLILMFEPVFIGMIICDQNVLDTYFKIFKESFKHGVDLKEYL